MVVIQTKIIKSVWKNRTLHLYQVCYLLHYYVICCTMYVVTSHFSLFRPGFSLDRIQSYFVTKSSHISDTHGESTQVSILDRGRPNLASLSGLSPNVSVQLGYLCLTNHSLVQFHVIETGLGGFNLGHEHNERPNIW